MKAARTRAVGFVAASVLLFLVVAAPGAQAQSPRVLLAEIDGPIDRSTVDYMQEAISEAQAGGYAALVVRFDTPGGGLTETEDITQLMLGASGTPILGFVAPSGADAFSAGTILLVGTDLAAMAPGTTIGSVQPVVLGPSGFEPVTDEKILQAVEGSLAATMALHGRNTSLASRFVRENLNLEAADAMALGATELVEAYAATLPGGTILKGLRPVIAGAEVVTFQPSLRVRFLAILSDPLVSSLLLILGIYALIFGLSAPGHGGEIAGVILIVLALVGLGFSVDPIALFLIALGIVLLIVELKTPGFGAFGTGGIVSIAIAAVFLAPLRPPEFVVTPEYQAIFLAALLTPTLAFGGFLLFALYKVMEIRRRKPQIGAMVGDEAVAVDPIRAGEKGYVQYEGELWQAIPTEDLAAGTKVYIHAEDGMILRVSTSAPPAPPKPTWRERLLRPLAPKPRGPGNP
jgi:membrane-bound serine protease (ClpP class)